MKGRGFLPRPVHCDASQRHGTSDSPLWIDSDALAGTNCERECTISVMSPPLAAARAIGRIRMMIDTPPPHTVDARPTVLVVDDERAIRELVAALLEDEGYLVRRARDGLEALNLVEGNRIDLVLSDVRMPRLDGAALARRIRQRGYDLPVILMSAVYADVDVPGVQFVPKPFEVTRLFSAIAGALEAGKRPIA